MNAVIKVSSFEFNEELFNKISLLLKGRDAEITIAVKEKNDFADSERDLEDSYFSRLSKSIKEIEQGEGKLFTMKELEAYISEGKAS